MSEKKYMFERKPRETEMTSIKPCEICGETMNSTILEDEIKSLKIKIFLCPYCYKRIVLVEGSPTTVIVSGIN